MYMINNGVGGDNFVIYAVGGKALRIVIFDRDVKPIVEETFVGMKKGGLIMRPLDCKPELKKFVEMDDGEVAILANLGCDSNIMMVEDAWEERMPDMTHRMFISVSEYNSEKFLLASEPPHWMSEANRHFLYKFGKPAAEFPKTEMTFEESIMFQLDRMKASLEDPEADMREAWIDSLEELRDMNVVFVESEDDGPSEEEFLAMSEEEREEMMLSEMGSAKCSYTDLMASLSVLMAAEERKKQRLREEAIAERKKAIARIQAAREEYEAREKSESA